MAAATISGCAFEVSFITSSAALVPSSIKSSSQKPERRSSSARKPGTSDIQDERKPSDLSEWEMGLSALKVATIVDDWND